MAGKIIDTRDRQNHYWWECPCGKRHALRWNTTKLVCDCGRVQAFPPTEKTATKSIRPAA